jgi:hypothetical protein
MAYAKVHFESDCPRVSSCWSNTEEDWITHETMTKGALWILHILDHTTNMKCGFGENASQQMEKQRYAVLM